MYKDLMDIDVEVRGNSIVYKYTYLIDVDANTKELLQESLAAQKETIDAVLVEARKDVPELESMIYEYYAKDGKLIVSEEYK